MENNLGIWLQLQRFERQITQSKLAELAHLDRSVINKIESNLTTEPSAETLKAIAHALKIPPESIFRAAGYLPENTELSTDQERLLYLFNNLTPEQQRYALKLLEALGDES
jgi:transcriptional regulator with XRE-family HTH domain